MIIINKILEFLSRPFRTNLSLFVLIFLLTSVVNLSGTYGCSMFFLGGLAVQNFLLSYVLTAIYSCISNLLIRNLYIIILLFLLYVNFLMDAFVVVNFYRRVDEDVVHIILDTNAGEAKEFLEEFTSMKLILLYSISIVLGFLMYKTSNRPSCLSRRMSKLLSVITVFTIPFIIISNIHITNFWTNTIIGKTYLFLTVPKVPDLKSYYSHPKLQRIDQLPKNVVVIFGESLSKSHTSIYGYKKKTTPRLEQLHKDSLLFVFQNVESPATRTVTSFQYMMSTYSHNSPKETEWYQCVTIPEIIKLSGYTSYWVSNQCQKGIMDNVIGHYADLCDSMQFVGNRFAGGLKVDFDEEVLLPLKNYKQDSLNFYFVHLMGNHVKFESRYPDNFNLFKDSDYTDYPKEQRHDLSTYDNSVIYNDYVVTEIIKLFQYKESIVLYFPDHAIDIYESSDDYCGHAKVNDAQSVKVSTQIPFVIYCSPTYQKNFPEKIKRIEKNIMRPFNTENLIFTIMDIIGVVFPNDTAVQDNSLIY